MSPKKVYTFSVVEIIVCLKVQSALTQLLRFWEPHDFHRHELPFHLFDDPGSGDREAFRDVNVLDP